MATDFVELFYFKEDENGYAVPYLDNGKNINLTTLGVYTKSEVTNFLALKVDKVAGYALSKNDYSDAEKAKLTGLDDLLVGNANFATNGIDIDFSSCPYDLNFGDPQENKEPLIVYDSGKVYKSTITNNNTAIRKYTLPDRSGTLADDTDIANLASTTALKQPCRVATTANITLSGTQTIDGVAVVAGNRVLVKNQTLGATNGVYTVAAGAWSRSTDFDTSAKIKSGCMVAVSEGTLNSDIVFMLTTNDTIVLGSTALVFSCPADIVGLLNGRANFDNNSLDLDMSNSPFNLNFGGHPLEVTEKKIVFDLTQNGTAAPTADYIYNQMGIGTFSFARTGVGVYTITSSGKFTVGKTDCFVYDWTDIISIVLTDVNTITISVNDDGMLTDRRIVIIIYP